MQKNKVMLLQSNLCLIHLAYLDKEVLGYLSKLLIFLQISPPQQGLKWNMNTNTYIFHLNHFACDH